MTSIYGSRHHGCRVDEFLWRGHRLIVLENEVLRISVLASKGADIVELRYKPHALTCCGTHRSLSCLRAKA